MGKALLPCEVPPWCCDLGVCHVPGSLQQPLGADTQSRGFFLVIPSFGMSVWMWVPCLCRYQVFAIPLGFALHSCWKCLGAAVGAQPHRWENSLCPPLLW